MLCGVAPLPMKMELTEGSETSAYINQMPGNYPKGNLLNSASIWYDRSNIFFFVCFIQRLSRCQENYFSGGVCFRILHFLVYFAQL